MPFRRFKPISAFEKRTDDAMRLAARITAREAPVQLSATGAALNIAGFRGLDHYDQRILADGGNQFSLEPPDQALAVGAGKVVEVVNNALMVYDTTGKPLLVAPVSMNKFFLQFSEINRTTGERGASLSDPRAYYDAATQRFFVVEWATLNDARGNPLNISVQFLAVSQTSDPTGSWYVYNFETTNPDTPGCPCLPDFQQLGVDANGVYITHNLFSLGSGGYSGASIYALPKAGLENGSTYAVEFPVQPNDFTIHPTVVPAGGNFASEGNGTEYFVETTDDLTNNGLSNVVNIWAMSNTSSLLTNTPSLSLAMAPVTTQTVDAILPASVERDGSRPLGGPTGLNDPAPLLSPGDGRVSSTPVYVNGQIWAVGSTGFTRTDKSQGTGVAWFQIAASGGAGALNASVTSQGIIARAGHQDLLYPAIAMNTTGAGGIGITLVGPTYAPSTAFIAMPEFVNPTITILRSGNLPDDGFTAYAQYGGGGVGRWGDYAAAAVDENGALWFANEYVPPVNALYPRSLLANWGTGISQIH